MGTMDNVIWNNLVPITMTTRLLEAMLYESSSMAHLAFCFVLQLAIYIYLMVNIPIAMTYIHRRPKRSPKDHKKSQKAQIGFVCFIYNGHIRHLQSLEGFAVEVHIE